MFHFAIRSIFIHSLNKYLLNIYCVSSVFSKLLIQQYTKEIKIPGHIKLTLETSKIRI